MKNSFITSVYIVGFLWLILILDVIIPIRFFEFGISPREISGITGILFAPFLHGGVRHLVSNSIPLLILLTTLFYFYPKISVKVLILSIIIGGGLVWLFARSSYHIGASGVVFSLVGFLIASGIFRKNIKAILISIVVFLMYGGVIWGVLPGQRGVSWEGHLFGFIVGIVLAYVFKDRRK